MCRIRQQAMIAGCIFLTSVSASGRCDAASLLAERPAAPLLEQPAEAAPGAELAELLALAYRFSPEMAAAALDAQAADAAVRGAGALEDPEITLSLEDGARTGAGLPGRPGTLILGIEQRFPWWGKRRLQRSVAEADAAAATAAARLVRSELELRLKRAFADAWVASRAVALTKETAADLRTLAEVAAERHAIGLAGRGDVSEAEIALSAVSVEQRRLEAELRTAKAQINALVNRPTDAALADPAALPPIPPEDLLTSDALLARALEASPVLAELHAAVGRAQGNRGLAEAAWYPDLALGVGVVEGVSGEEDGYEASLSLTLPLQWGVRQARNAEASARLSAAEHRLSSAQRDIEASLAASLNALSAERFRSELLGGPDLRQAEAGLAAAEAGYPLGRTEIADVLQARRRLRDIRLEQLRSEAEQRRLLADIEFLIGGEL